MRSNVVLGCCDTILPSLYGSIDLSLQKLRSNPLLVERERLPDEPDLVPALREACANKPSDLAVALLEPYLRITEDPIWTLLSVASGRSDDLGRLANRILNRESVPSFLVAKHKHDVLEQELAGAGLRRHQYRIRQLRRHFYSQSSTDQVFLVDRPGDAPLHITSKSTLVSKLGDQPDTEAVLVIFDDSAKLTILSVARRARCLEHNESVPPSKPLAKARDGEPPVSAPVKSAG